MMDIFAGLLPIAVLALLVLAARRPAAPLIDAIVPGALLWALLAAASLEALSVFSLINWTSLFLFWLAGALAVAAIVLHRRRKSVERFVGDSEPERDLPFMVLGAAAAAIVAVTLIVGVLSTPNNLDSLHYHLPRIEQWIQQGSLANFPTADHRQLAMSPLPEMLILHLRVLSETDWFDNLVQSLAFAGCVATAAVVARRLGAARSGQVLAGVIVATLPIAICEGSSTQTDLVASFFLLAAAERLLAWRDSGRTMDGLAVGAAVGLALLAKGTAYFFAAPIGFMVLVIIVKNRRWTDVGVGAAMVALILAINANHLCRSLPDFFSPGGGELRTASANHSPNAIASSLVRNIASNFVTPSQRFNNALIEGVAEIHRVIGIDMNDPGTTFQNTRFSYLPRNVLSGDTAPNPLQMVLVFMTAAMLVVRRRRPDDGAAMPAVLPTYFGAAVLGGVIFCALLRWQPWITRLQLPFFILIAPATAAILSVRVPRRWLIAGGAVLVIAAIPFAICNQERPLYGDPVRPFANHFAPNVAFAEAGQLMFWSNPKKDIAARSAVAAIGERATGGVGLIVGGEEYPYWRMLKGDRFRRPVRIENVCLPADPLHFYRPSTFQPLVVLTDLPQPPTLRCANGIFDRRAGFPTGDPAPLSTISVYYRRAAELPGK
jgi:4-amino-4-deoxy-L-arabinose transferase-like glycosyltransferase